MVEYPVQFSRNRIEDASSRQYFELMFSFLNTCNVLPERKNNPMWKTQFSADRELTAGRVLQANTFAQLFTKKSARVMGALSAVKQLFVTYSTRSVTSKVFFPAD